jgi:protein involved in polysaccharide export with SLBB domain
MRRLLLFLVIIIILVSLNWFHELMAQDLSQLSESDRATLLKRYQGSINPPNDSNKYRTPAEFGAGQPPQTPVAGSPTDATAGKMIDFEKLQPFGLELFAGPRESAPPDDIASSSDYILGPGDNIAISLWGRVEQEYNLTIDREGKLFIPKVGEMIAWGKTLDQFRSYAKQKLSSVYSDFEMNVSLGKIRSIRVYLTGEVNRPGAYTISSLTSLFNALYLAGGPNGNGSMRDVRLMRGGKATATLDLYQLLLKGDNTSDVRLESGDAIFVPVAGSRTAIRGEIRRPAIYELKGGETASELLALAGNPTPEAHLDRVMLERVSKRQIWEVLDLNLNPSHPDKMTNMALMDGDRITVFSIFDARANMVAIAGKVKHPGYYERTDSTHIRDLIAQGQLQDYDVYYGRADLFRTFSDGRQQLIPVDLKAVLAGSPKDNLALTDFDSLHIYSLEDVGREKYVYIDGEVKNPGRYPLYEDMTVKDLVFLAGSFARGASRLQGELARTDSLGNVSLEYMRFDDSAAGAKSVQEDDRLYVRQIPEWQLHRAVRLDGEVQFPGEYVMANRDETLFQLVRRAGGFTRNAFPEGTLFERRSIGANLQRRQVPNLLERSAPLVEDSSGRIQAALPIQYDSTSANRIIINMAKIIASNGREGDLVLEPGDRIYVPSQPSGISVMGEVGAGGTIKFTEHKSVKYYIERAGNFTRRSDKGQIRLIRSDGQVTSGSGTLDRRVELGDIILVPARIERDKDWFRTVTTALTATAGLLTSVFVITKL